MITLCMICSTVTKVNLKARGGLSHGICIDCLPGYLRQNEMTEKEIQTFMEEYRRKQP